MDAESLAFASRELLLLIEACGLAGTWEWVFATGEQIWSPSLYALLGFAPGIVRPDYGLLHALIHPEDQPRVETPGQVRREGRLGSHTVRITRPDGSMRVLSTRGTVHHAPDGRPRGAAGLLLDVTDRARLAAVEREEETRRRILFEHAQTWTHTSRYTTSYRVASREMLALTGVTQDEYLDDWAHVLVPEQRSRLRPRLRAQIEAGRPFSTETRFRLAGGGHGDFRGVFAPVRDAEGRVEAWATMTRRTDGFRPEVSGTIRRGLEQGIAGRHLRAARALLDWSMADLARASGLSLSTIRRLEDGGEGPAARSRHVAVAALRAAGIGFVLLDDGATVAVARTGMVATG
ncbi:PAS domain-containing protein [Methylobacterium oryzihabitans]|uniref:histidine kinase n=1 Tax=Methylobacterium oryzihabitans TaxID=2499852 RepID=A0A3S2V5H8_9HYPH|nr:PAS domain-containing protein [Methylobacterium oryzihabitans]RVU14064.1 helix-turn-helix domain-containing protein [Methylobacterium oryzihabitans]